MNSADWLYVLRCAAIAVVGLGALSIILNILEALTR